MMRIRRENVYFVLAEPQTPGNIGAVARAIKTMGFTNLCLVNPADPNSNEARWMAHASGDILENAEIFDTLNAAVKDKHFVVATTQRERGFHLPFFTPKELAKKVIPISSEHKIAIVFGREQTGLTNEELGMCDAISTIPAHIRHPSLNLAQSVMVYAYEFYQASYEDLEKYQWKCATHGDLQILYKHLRKSLERVDFVPLDNWKNFQMRFSRLMGRANAEVRDVKVWHKILDSFDSYLDLHENKMALLQKKAQEPDETSS